LGEWGIYEMRGKQREKGSDERGRRRRGEGWWAPRQEISLVYGKLFCGL